MYALAGARVVTPRRVLDPGWLTLAGGRIVSVGAGDPPGDHPYRARDEPYAGRPRDR